MNQDTAFLSQWKYLPRLLNSHVYFASMERLSRGKYSVKFDLISTPNQNHNKDILSEYVRKLEHQIKQKPDEWLWTHKEVEIYKRRYIIFLSINYLILVLSI